MEEQINKQNQNSQNKKLIVFLVLIGGFLLLMIIFLSRNFLVKNKKITAYHTQTSSPTILIQPTKGSLNFKLTNKNFHVNSPFSIVIIANSEDEQVVGMDLVIKFDKNNFKFLNTKSIHNQFTAYYSMVDNYLSITLVKNLTAKEPVYFRQSEVIVLQFLPLAKSPAIIEIVSQHKNRKTFFVNEKTQVFYPKLPERLIFSAK